ncbi:MAG: ABC-type enterochelin transport system, permease component, partial [Microbacterium sp.]|nr:ABC-type enterochelin transport system, permease component [Microbacterium sp.]
MIVTAPSSRKLGHRVALPAAAAGVAALVVLSLFVGAYDLTADAFGGEMFFISRVPRTLALVLAGCAMAVSGLIMQLLTQNRFVEPSTTGTSEWAALGLLVTVLLAPGAPLLVRMVVASVAAFVGTMIFIGILRRISLRSSLVVPLIGIMLGAVVSAFT